MLEYLNNEFNKGKTANGAFAYNSTKSDVLDMFALGGAFRNRSDFDVQQLFSKAYGENPLLAMKVLFYLRDIQLGQGERRFFKTVLKHLALHHKASVIKNLHLIPEFGRWDDILVLLDTDVKQNVISLISDQLKKDLVSENPSLMAKWLPSENASSQETKKYGRIVRQGLGYSSKQYRKTLSNLREKINIVETHLTEKEYSEIDYSKLPSHAGMKYRTAFFRNDEERYRDFLDKLTNGEVKVNANTLYPSDIVGKAFDGWSGRNVWSYSYSGRTLTTQDIQLLDGQWKALPDYIGESTENSIAVVDTSGSMGGTPMNVAVSLGIYLAERNKGVFHNHFLTFNSTTQLKKVVGQNIVEKARNLSDSAWGGSTNIESVFRVLLDTAVKNNVPEEEMVGKVYIISDMQFDRCAYGSDLHTFKVWEKKFNEAGYKLPNLVFWNVNAFMSNTPFTMNEQGVQLVSGYSPTIFKQLLSADGKTPYELMLEVVETERYAEVTV